MGRMACTEPQCLYNGALYLLLLQHICNSDFNFILIPNFAIMKYDKTVLNITINYVFQMAVKYLQIYLFFPVIIQTFTWRSADLNASTSHCIYRHHKREKMVEKRVDARSRTTLMASHITEPCSGPEDQLCTNNYQTVLRKDTCNLHFVFYEASMGTGFCRGGKKVEV
jgi:hypothetical protein